MKGGLQDLLDCRYSELTQAFASENATEMHTTGSVKSTARKDGICRWGVPILPIVILISAGLSCTSSSGAVDMTLAANERFAEDYRVEATKTERREDQTSRAYALFVALYSNSSAYGTIAQTVEVYDSETTARSAFQSYDRKRIGSMPQVALWQLGEKAVEPLELSGTAGDEIKAWSETHNSSGCVAVFRKGRVVELILVSYRDCVTVYRGGEEVVVSQGSPLARWTLLLAQKAADCIP